MEEHINREDVLKCLEYNTIQKPSANDVVSATLRVAREKVEKLPVAQEGALLSFWRERPAEGRNRSADSVLQRN